MRSIVDELTYPLRVVCVGGVNWDGIPMDGAEIYGPFHLPGELWLWANREGYLVTYRGWRDDINGLIREYAPRGWRAIKVALDEWATNDLVEAEYGDGSHALILQGNDAWREWQRAEEDAETGSVTEPPEGWRAVGPVCSCGCEDWPCCVHADDHIYVPE